MAKALLLSTFQSRTAYKMNLQCDLAFQAWAVPFHSACNIRTKHKQKLRTRIALSSYTMATYVIINRNVPGVRHISTHLHIKLFPQHGNSRR